MWSHMCEPPWWFSVSLQQRLHHVWTGPLRRWVYILGGGRCTQQVERNTRMLRLDRCRIKKQIKVTAATCFIFQSHNSDPHPVCSQISTNAAWTMAAASTVVRTPWADLNVFAILATGCTGTRRTASVSQHLLRCERFWKCVWPCVFWTQKTSGTKNRRYFEFWSLCFSLNFHPLDFTCRKMLSPLSLFVAFAAKQPSAVPFYAGVFVVISI